MTAPSSIQQLPSFAIAQIKSSIIINSLHDVVLGLIENSLDARASKISVHVYHRNGSCNVEDDGSGIMPFEFEPNGGLAKLHYSSKSNSTSDEIPNHGGGGRFLYSVASLSTITIISKHQEYHSTNVLTIKQSNVLRRQSLDRAHSQMNSTTGTKVIVQDLFAGMPVRIKHRVSTLARDLDQKKEYNGLVKAITALLLAWHREITVVIIDTESEDVLCIKSARSRRCRQRSSNVLVNVLYQARLISTPERSSWVPVEASDQKFRVYGAISLDAAPTKNVQFLSMHIHPLPNTNSCGLLYKVINRCFWNSAFGSSGLADTSRTSTHHTEGLEDRSYSRADDNEKGLNRFPMFYMRIDVRPHIRRDLKKVCADAEALAEHDYVLHDMSSLLQAMSVKFLRQQHFRPTHIDMTHWVLPKRIANQNRGTSFDKHNSNISNMQTHMSCPKPPPKSVDGKPTDLGIYVKLPSFQSNQKIEHVGIPTAWANMKSSTSRSLISLSINNGSSSVCNLNKVVTASTKIPTSAGVQRTSSTVSVKSHSSDICTEFTPSTMLVDANVSNLGTLIRPPFDKKLDLAIVEIPDPADIASVSEQRQEEQYTPFEETPLTWVNPVTRLQSMIDPRTGFDVHTIIKSSEDLDHARRLNVGIRCSSLNATPPEWLHKTLVDWENPVFQSTELPIPKITTIELSHQIDRNCSQIEIEKAFKSLSGTIGNIAKHALQNGEVIRQVDAKFILVSVIAGEKKTLVLVDQHAADERCRIEELLQQLFCAQQTSNSCVESAILGIPISFDLQVIEIRLLEVHRCYFQRWGIQFQETISTKSEKCGIARVQVTHLPATILEKCQRNPKLLVELIRTELWKQDKVKKTNPMEVTQPIGKADDTSSSRNEQHFWLKHIHNCPQGILDMLNSRACRSAIMFNDELSLIQCQGLIRRLAACAFPFQCAHGRPSLVPLIDLSILDRTDRKS